LDCRSWPLVWDYHENSKKLVIFLGECALEKILLDDRAVLESMKKMVIQEVGWFTAGERKVFTSFEKNESVKKIDELEISYE
ncbi:MAG: hypothetical protein ACTSRW_17725, partial [Candidatus Helarchaeota archaeon]